MSGLRPNSGNDSDASSSSWRYVNVTRVPTDLQHLKETTTEIPYRGATEVEGVVCEGLIEWKQMQFINWELTERRRNGLSC